jgi:hypothetical protein
VNTTSPQSLHLLQVFGSFGARRSPGRVTSVTAGKFVTAAVLRALPDPRDVETAYKRAVQADPANADVLRQFETYIPEYDKFGRGDDITGCLLCSAGELCEFCALKHEYLSELKAIPLGPGGRLRRLDSIRDFLFDIEKPKLQLKPRKTRGTKGVLSGLKVAFTSGKRAGNQQGADDDMNGDAVDGDENEELLDDDDAAFFAEHEGAFVSDAGNDTAGADDHNGTDSEDEAAGGAGKKKQKTTKNNCNTAGTTGIGSTLGSPFKSVLALARGSPVHP